MKTLSLLSTLFFALLLSSCTQNNQLTDLATNDDVARQFHLLYQNFSNDVVALSKSKLSEAERSVELIRLADELAAHKPATVDYPATLFKADGTPMSSEDVDKFMEQLTNKPMMDLTEKSIDEREYRCLVEYYTFAWIGTVYADIFPDHVIVLSPALIQSIYPATVCSQADIYLSIRIPYGDDGFIWPLD